jgi:dUTP pyrophosphatase
MHIRITRTHPEAELPTYQTPGSVAFDIAVIEDTTIAPKSGAKIPTGLVIATPKGFALLIAARSSIFWKKGLLLTNGVGVIDQDFCGPNDEIKLSLWNPTDAPVIITKGERLGQGLFVPVERAEWLEGPAQGPSRGGFGSTG